jgi:exopolysaccharide production protein ExoQ
MGFGGTWSFVPQVFSVNDKFIPKLHNGHILGATAALFVPLAVLLAKGIAPLFVVSALGVLLIGLIKKRTVTLWMGPVLLFLSVFAGGSLLTWFWSITPGETLKTGIHLAATFFGAAVLYAAAGGLSKNECKIFQNGMILGGFIGFALIAFEFATNAWLSRFLYGLDGKLLFLIDEGYTAALNPGLAATALYFWPWSLAVWKRFRPPVAVTGISSAALLFLLSQSEVVVLCLIAGSVACALALVASRIMPLLLAAVVALGVLAAPAIPGLIPDPMVPGKSPPYLSPSAIHRIVIWKNAVKHIREKPIFGSGFDTTRGLYGVEDKVRYLATEKTGKVAWDSNYEPIPLHPHNGFLQVWLELGAVGAVILLGLLLAVIRDVYQLVPGRVNRAATLGMMTTWLSIAASSFGAWQGWWLASVFLAAAFMVSMLDPFGAAKTPSFPPETGGPKGLEPTRYGDWERKGRAVDF